MKINGKVKLKDNIIIPGDKSISHRSIIFASISDGITKIKNVLLSEDIYKTIDCFIEMGVKIDINQEKREILVYGVGKDGLKPPKKELYCGNSGTTMRLLMGLLVGQKFDSILIGDESLNNRPMYRVINPLEQMGAKIKSSNGKAPIHITGNRNINSIEYIMPIASAQVKSAIILASLYAEKNSNIIENTVTRDHTEKMLDYFEKNNWIVEEVIVPNDISSAAFLIVAALIEKKKMIFRNIGINPTRTGLLEVLENMGGKIYIENKKSVNNELIGDIYIKQSELSGTIIDKKLMGRIIDEIPILSVIAAFSRGETIINDAEELKYKETDRLKAIYTELKKYNVKIKILDNGLVIKESKDLRPTSVKSYNDHRIAMALSIMAFNIEGESFISDVDSINISFPEFYENFRLV